MLELQDVSLQLPGEDEQLLLTEISASFPTTGHFAAILGPSGCGKSTFLKVVAGLREQTLGKIIWEGCDLTTDEDLAPNEIGYVPQFSIAYELLTVQENAESALRLRVSNLRGDELASAVEQILSKVGLLEIRDRQVKVLSGGQKRRLALALELASSPRLLLCDEVTSGLDPKAEDEIAHLLHDLSRQEKRLVLNVTHSLRHLSLYDTVVVLFEGHLAYHGSPEYMFHYFGVEKHEELFPRLAKRSASDWSRSWLKYRDAYYEKCGLAPIDPERKGEDEQPSVSTESENTVAETADSAENESPEREASETGKDLPAPVVPSEPITPSPFSQFSTLLSRRWTLFFRDRAQVILQLALLFGFPLLVVIFALDGLPELKGLSSPVTGGFIQEIKDDFAHRAELIHTGGLVSGLIMFQVILLALIGSNNAAREIANERLIFEKEKFAGLSPLAYVCSKLAFLAALVVCQSAWMTLFVNWIVHLPGSLPEQLLLLTLVNAALTSVSLGISALLRTPEQASLVSVYLVGFQLPLSGAVLALPKFASLLTRPFIASYWGWSGFIQTFRDTRFYDAIQTVTQTGLSPEGLCAWILALHVVIGAALAFLGSRNPRWE